MNYELQKRKMVYIPQCAAGVLSVRKCAKLIGIAPYSVSRLKARYRQFGAAVSAAVVLGYKLDDKATSTEIIARDVELRDYLRRFFMGKTSAELSPKNEDNLEREIRNGINDFILSSSKIRAVKFQSLDIQ